MKLPLPPSRCLGGTLLLMVILASVPAAACDKTPTDKSSCSTPTSASGEPDVAIVGAANAAPVPDLGMPRPADPRVRNAEPTVTARRAAPRASAARTAVANPTHPVAPPVV